ncbi:hypothetical protein WJX72_006588 [[Myrmecia] bisecta]|uniref:BZIP domain-containing protein n=1 Tax=[Myrmecia] bisecta TaxID=41462 RepID=A0AAW1PCY9_9CHLO
MMNDVGVKPGEDDRSSSDDPPQPAKKKVGRPVTLKANPYSKTLTEEDRRRIKRRTANRESARRVRHKRQEQVDALQLEVTAMHDKWGLVVGENLRLLSELAVLRKTLQVNVTLLRHHANVIGGPANQGVLDIDHTMSTDTGIRHVGPKPKSIATARVLQQVSFPRSMLRRFYTTLDAEVVGHGLCKAFGDTERLVIVSRGAGEALLSRLETILSCARGLEQAAEQLRYPDGTLLELQMGLAFGEVTDGLLSCPTFLHAWAGRPFILADALSAHGVPRHVQVAAECATLLSRQGYALVSRALVQVTSRVQETCYLVANEPQSLATLGDAPESAVAAVEGAAEALDLAADGAASLRETSRGDRTLDAAQNQPGASPICSCSRSIKR